MSRTCLYTDRPCGKVRAWAAAIALAAGLPSAAALATDVPADNAAFYQEQVRPILQQHCFECHGGQKKVQGGLRLTTHAGVIAGGESGPAVNLESVNSSRIMAAVNYDGLEMPPSGRLSPAEIQRLRDWIVRGIPFGPTEKDEADVPADPTHEKQAQDFRAADHWSLLPVRRAPLPVVARMAWSSSPIDAWIRRRLEQVPLTPSGPADKVTLLRRATYDLTGLAPTPDAINDFLADPSDDAFDRVVDRLLSSPRYGEKWGRHWLDLVHYAETNSFERDGPKPEIWRYRDYVVTAFNEDRPYDQFMREQLAGDEMTPKTLVSMTATGYFRLGLWDDEAADPLQARYDELDDFVTTTSQVFMAMTLNCARCHDHKLDPISQSDYYRMLAFFQDIRSFQNEGAKGFSPKNYESPLRDLLDADARRFHDETIRRLQEAHDDLRAKMSALEDSARKQLPGGVKDDFQHEANRLPILRERVGTVINADDLRQYEAWQEGVNEITERRSRMSPVLMTVKAISHPPATHIMVRGSPHNPGAQVEPGFPSPFQESAPGLSPVPADADSSGRRSTLVDWMTNTRHPLTARVMVNRLWQHHFGRGLVATPNDFGHAGDRPTHPELLDWLAHEFMQQGWDIKHMHRIMMLSNTYRQSSSPHTQGLATDPENQWLWRYRMRRLTSEEIRDGMLMVHGRLNLQIGGPSRYTTIPAEVLETQSQPGAGWQPSEPAQQARRSLYIHVKRSLAEPMLERFDAADTDNSCPVRFVTTQPTQALTMLNSNFVDGQAAAFADFLMQHDSMSRQDRLNLALRLAYSRPIDEQEVHRGDHLVQSLREEQGLDERTALKVFCLMVLNSNEFVYLD